MQVWDFGGEYTLHVTHIIKICIQQFTYMYMYNKNVKHFLLKILKLYTLP